jgi:hypothetical protein
MRTYATKRYSPRRLGTSKKDVILEVVTVLGIAAAFIAVLIGAWLLASLWLMLGVGIAHLHWWHAMPSMGYQTALLIDIFIGGWFGMVVAINAGSRRKS